MLLAVPLFVSGIADKVADLALNCLAVAGGYLVGYLVGGTVAWALDKWLFAHKTPDTVKKGVAILSGVAVAILVALIVFGKGSGSGGGGGDGAGRGADSPSATPADHGKQSQPPQDPKTPPPKVEPTTAPPVEPDAPQVKVTFLGGAAVPPGDQRFYLIGDDTEKRRTFDEVKAAVEQKKAEAGPRQLLLVVQYPTDRKLAADERSRTVTQVTEWAEAAGIRVISGAGKK